MNLAQKIRKHIGDAVFLKLAEPLDGIDEIPAGIISVNKEKNTVTFLHAAGLTELAYIRERNKSEEKQNNYRALLDLEKPILEDPENHRTISIDKLTDVLVK